VQWVPEKKLVVVRYVAAPIPTPPPTAPPTAPPTKKPVPPATPAPTPSPSPTPKPVVYERFIVGDYVFHPKVYNEFSGGIVGNDQSYAARGAIEFPLFNLPWMIEGDYRSYQYQHNSGYVTTVGGAGSTYVPGFTPDDTDIDGRFGLKVVDPRIYVGVGYLSRSENYGYPRQSGVGFGAEKLPDLDQPFSVYGSVWYYPDVTANYAGSQFSYRDTKYQVGATYTVGSFTGFGLFLDGGFMGDSLRGKTLAPSDASHSGAYLGLGLKF
jgi:hypothetical protein